MTKKHTNFYRAFCFLLALVAFIGASFSFAKHHWFLMAIQILGWLYWMNELDK